MHQSLESSPPIQRPQSSIAHVNLGPNAQTYIVTERIVPPSTASQAVISTSASNDSNLSDNDEHPEINSSANPANNNNVNDNADADSQSDDAGYQQV